MTFPRTITNGEWEEEPRHLRWVLSFFFLSKVRAIERLAKLPNFVSGHSFKRTPQGWRSPAWPPSLDITLFFFFTSEFIRLLAVQVKESLLTRLTDLLPSRVPSFGRGERAARRRVHHYLRNSLASFFWEYSISEWCSHHYTHSLIPSTGEEVQSIGEVETSV